MPKVRIEAIFPGILVLSGFLLSGASGCVGSPPLTQAIQPGWTGILESLIGVWRDPSDPDFFLEVAGSQILIASAGRVREAATVLGPTEGGLLVCQDGHERSLQIRRIAEVIEFHSREGRTRRLERTSLKPKALALVLDLPSPAPLPESRIEEIQREVRLRFQSDQSLFRQRIRGQEDSLPWLQAAGSVLSNPKPEGFDFLAVDRFGENAEYMRNLILEVGWIDAKRFGYPVSKNAFVLVQHSWEPPLMLSVLPWIKGDVDAGLMPGEDYALLYDRAQLALGRLQRYGSQLAKNAAGEWFVLPLEDPEGVDARRKEWGLQPLRDYVGIFGASEVKLSTECSALASSH